MSINPKDSQKVLTNIIGSVSFNKHLWIYFAKKSFVASRRPIEIK